jgi:peptide/histidine transporter 3/4
MLHCVFIDPSAVIIPLTVTVASFQVLYYYDIRQSLFYGMLIGTLYVFFAILQIFYPLAGYLADVKYGRKKCVVSSLWISLATIIPLGLVGFVAVGLLFLPYYNNQEWPYVVMSVIVILLVIPTIIVTVIFFSSIVAFNANVIQFGLDQLHDAQTEHLILFIHWYVLLSYVGTELIKTSISSINLWSICYFQTNPTFAVFVWIVTIPSAFAVICSFLLLLSLCVIFRKCHTWSNFLSDSGSKNPYKLVYKVISFSREHSYPIRRSAFTYCEDELPSGLDLGKEKYGGPFTTEQVEDVKAFVGIFTVLLAFGPLFAVERSINFLLQLFIRHLFGPLYLCSESFINTAFPSLIVVVLLVFYAVFVLPLVQNYIPSMLKRIGLGMMLMLTPILCFFILDTTGHATTMSNTCFLLGPSNNTEEELLNIGFGILIIPITVSICGSMIFYIAIFEFLYSQSPHSMKGLMIGTFFAIRGIFQMLGILVILFPFLGWKSSASPFPSCGFVYNLICIIIVFFGMVAFVWIAKRYQHRQRDEPDNVYRYAEEYYEKLQDESHGDSDNYYDNLNVHTID